MSNQTGNSRPFGFLLPTEIEGFDSLAELALDLRWSWNHCADEVWRKLDPPLWELTHNPWVVLQTVSRDRLRRTLADPDSASASMPLCKLEVKPLRDPRGSSKIIPGLL